jgi:cytochrome c biogenesis protein CcmG/thiol:disulfide interchange protein DsbE
MNEEVSKKLGLVIPLILFVALIPLFFFAMGEDKEEIPSPLIGKKIPDFFLPSLDGEHIYDRQSLLGEPFILNVWGSWCPSCIHEHPYLTYLNEQGVKIVGLNYKDTQEGASRFLDELGNPFKILIFDAQGELGIELGVYGAPESYLISAEGEILFKRVGVIDERIWKEQMEAIYLKAVNNAESEE